MKLFRYIIGFVALSLVMASCDADMGGNDKMEDGISLPAEYKSITLTGTEAKPLKFTAYASWQIRVAYPADAGEWLYISYNFGDAGEANLTVAATSLNETGADRKCSILIIDRVSDKELAVVQVTQKPEIAAEGVLTNIISYETGEAVGLAIKNDSQNRIIRFRDQWSYSYTDGGVRIIHEVDENTDVVTETTDYVIRDGRAVSYARKRTRGNGVKTDTYNATGTFEYDDEGRLVKEVVVKASGQEGVEDEKSTYTWTWEGDLIVSDDYREYIYGDEAALNNYVNADLWALFIYGDVNVMFLGLTGKRCSLMPTILVNDVELKYAVDSEEFITDIGVKRDQDSEFAPAFELEYE